MPNSEYWISALEPESASVAPTVRMPLLVGMSSGKEALYTACHNTHTHTHIHKHTVKPHIKKHIKLLGSASIIPADRTSTTQLSALFWPCTTPALTISANTDWCNGKATVLCPSTMHHTLPSYRVWSCEWFNNIWTWNKENERSENIPASINL